MAFRSSTCSIRTIPTRVGSTCAVHENVVHVTDHPHAGGEHFAMKLAEMAKNGPSPRGWGAPRNANTMTADLRTIPTRVGSTNSAFMPNATPSDHPHAGGEHPGLATGWGIQLGPSPRGWGALYEWNWGKCSDRTIPTRVGSTIVVIPDGFAEADHPHAGGEHVCAVGATRFISGPSPRGWGARSIARSNGTSGRTIPTRVGSTH